MKAPSTSALICLFSALLLLGGCNGPLAFVPGGKLRGPEQTASSWDMAAGFENLELETRPADPYSVRVNFTLKDGQLYVDPAADRRWYQHMVDDARVRVRFDEVIYPARAVPVTDPAEKKGFDPSRQVLRLEPLS